MLCKQASVASQLDEAVIVAEENDLLAAVVIVLRVSVDDSLVARLTINRIRISMVSEPAVLVEPEKAFAIRSRWLIIQLRELRPERILKGPRLVVVVVPVEFVVDTRCEREAGDWTSTFVVTVSLRIQSVQDGNPQCGGT